MNLKISILRIICRHFHYFEILEFKNHHKFYFITLLRNLLITCNLTCFFFCSPLRKFSHLKVTQLMFKFTTFRTFRMSALNIRVKKKNIVPYNKV